MQPQTAGKKIARIICLLDFKKKNSLKLYWLYSTRLNQKKTLKVKAFKDNQDINNFLISAELEPQTELINEFDDLDDITLMELEMLASENNELSEHAKFYLENRGLDGYEWRSGVGPVSVQDICSKKQKMLQELMQLCTNKLLFDTYFKQALLIKFTATFWDEHQFNSRNMNVESTKRFFTPARFSKKFAKQIQNVDSDLLFLRAVLDIIARELVRNNFRLRYIWRELISLALHPTLGYQVSLLFMTFNLKKLTTARDLERATMGVLTGDNYALFFYQLNSSLTKKNLETFLEYLEVPKTIINDLLIACVDQERLTPIISFLEKNNWFTQSGFAQGFAPPSTEDKIEQLKNNIALVRKYEHLRAHLAEVHKQIFDQQKIDLAAFEGNPIEKLVQFYNCPVAFQSYFNLIFRQDTQFVALFDAFLKAVFKQNQLLVNLLTPETFFSEGDKRNALKLASYTKIFIEEAGQLFESNHMKSVIENFKIGVSRLERTPDKGKAEGFFEKNLKKQDFNFLMSLCVALLAIGYAFRVSRSPGIPPIAPTVVISTAMAENRNTFETLDKLLVRVAAEELKQLREDLGLGIPSPVTPQNLPANVLAANQLQLVEPVTEPTFLSSDYTSFAKRASTPKTSDSPSKTPSVSPPTGGGSYGQGAKPLQGRTKKTGVKKRATQAELKSASSLRGSAVERSSASSPLLGGANVTSDQANTEKAFKTTKKALETWVTEKNSNLSEWEKTRLQITHAPDGSCSILGSTGTFFNLKELKKVKNITFNNELRAEGIAPPLDITQLDHGLPKFFRDIIGLKEGKYNDRALIWVVTNADHLDISKRNYQALNPIDSATESLKSAFSIDADISASEFIRLVITEARSFDGTNTNERFFIAATGQEFKLQVVSKTTKKCFSTIEFKEGIGPVYSRTKKPLSSEHATLLTAKLANGEILSGEQLRQSLGMSNQDLKSSLEQLTQSTCLQVDSLVPGKPVNKKTVIFALSASEGLLIDCVEFSTVPGTLDERKQVFSKLAKGLTDTIVLLNDMQARVEYTKDEVAAAYISRLIQKVELEFEQCCARCDQRDPGFMASVTPKVGFESKLKRPLSVDDLDDFLTTNNQNNLSQHLSSFLNTSNIKKKGPKQEPTMSGAQDVPSSFRIYPSDESSDAESPE